MVINKYMTDYMRKYREDETVRQKTLASNKEYREKNKKKIGVYQKKYREEHPDYYKEYMKGYMQMKRKRDREELIKSKRNLITNK